MNQINHNARIDSCPSGFFDVWDRYSYIVRRIRKQFPKTQIVTTTHTPLTASGIADIENAMLLKLDDEYEDNTVTARIVNRETLKGRRADQVLSSEAFGLVTSFRAILRSEFPQISERDKKFPRRNECIDLRAY
ncbi:hypothetical protein QUF72_07705 [Desulfobacterales bacterium HSG2]|nr:hypothetical protein [Desulfobacterales bacterium HSG2]